MKVIYLNGMYLIQVEAGKFLKKVDDLGNPVVTKCKRCCKKFVYDTHAIEFLANNFGQWIL